MPDAPDPPALLAADQSDNRIRLFNPFVAGDRKPDLWSYPKADETELTLKPTDAKRVPFAGKLHILIAYHGRVRLVRFEDHHPVKDYPSYGSCHSAEILPDGNLVTANSNDDMLRLHRGAEDFTDTELPYAHGVTWDKERSLLWALGDKLYAFRYDSGELVIEETIELPDSPTGHDLFPLRSEPKLLVSNNDALYLFDIPSFSFEKISDLGEIKSVSQHIDGTLWATDPENQEGSATWQTDAVIRVRPPDPEKRFRNAGAKFYKARWWQHVAFSY